MIYVCTCPECGLIVRTERPEGEKACVCSTPPEIVGETGGSPGSEADVPDEPGN